MISKIAQTKRPGLTSFHPWLELLASKDTLQVCTEEGSLGCKSMDCAPEVGPLHRCKSLPRGFLSVLSHCAGPKLLKQAPVYVIVQRVIADSWYP
mmetsp:Transcript_21138/g.40465  ORF Transcript_21138/g.40465 Transcript_21138/m.40465 type:complete len:95 (+) Transcript_21138:60-344(+)